MSRDLTCELKLAGSNLMLMENGLLSLVIVDIFNSGYTSVIEILSLFLPFCKINKAYKWAYKWAYVHSHQTISTSHMYNFDIFSLGPNHSYFAQGIYLIDKTENIPCAILEWSDTILELRNQVGILTLRRAILEWYRFLLCAEHIY